MTESKFVNSLESMTTDLHLWDIPSTQVGITATKIINYYPLTAIVNTDTITFNIPGQNKLMLDHIDIVSKIKINHNDVANNHQPESQVGVNNNLAHSLWRNVSVVIGGTNITQSFDYSYCISAFFDTIMNATAERADTLLYQQAFLMDEAKDKQASESLIIYEVAEVAADDTKNIQASPFKPVGNPSAAKRIERFAKSEAQTRVGTLIAPLAVSLFQQHKLLPDNLDIQIGLTKKEPKFCLQAAGNTDEKITIVDVYLKVHYKVPVDAALEAIELRLKREPCRYEAEAKIVTFHQFPYGTTSHTFHHLFTGKLPKFFVAAVNNRAAYAGNSHRNPWTFMPIAKVQCHVNGTEYFPKAVEGQEELFNAFQEALGYKLKGSCLIRSDIFGIHNMVPFTLTSDRTIRHHMNLMSTGVVDLEIDLTAATGADYALIVYAIYDRLIEIDNYRQIKLI